MEEKIKTGDNYFLIGGSRVHVRCMGKGQPLLLIHGLGGPLMWQRLIEPLSVSFRVFVFDFPGFGDSMCSPHILSTQGYASLVHDFLLHEEIQHVVCVGVSYGGQIAAHLAFQYPEQIQKLVLIASTGLATQSSLLIHQPVWAIFSMMVKYTVLRSQRLLCWFGSFSFYDIESRPAELCRNFFRQLAKPGNRDAWLDMLRNIYRPDEYFARKLSTLVVPTLIAWGSNDRTVPSKYASVFKELIPSAELTLFPECAHSVPLEKPQELCNAICAFADK